MSSTQVVDARQLMADAKFYDGYSRFDDKLGRSETWEEAVDRVMAMHERKYAGVKGVKPYIEEARAAYKAKRVAGAQRALQFGGEQLEKHNMKMYNCLAKETRFLSSTGIISFQDVIDGQSLVVKTHLGNWKPATVRNHGQQRLLEIKIGKTPTCSKTIYATADHRWILENGDVTTNLSVGDVIHFYEDTSFLDFDWSDATPNQKLYWCYGYVYGDGTRNGKYSAVRLCGKDARFVDRFEEMGWKTSSPNSIKGDVFVFTGKYQKTLPDPRIDDIELLRAFVAGYLAADGTKGNEYWDEESHLYHKHFTGIYAKSEEAQNFIRDVFPLVGAWVTSEKKLNIHTNFGHNDGVSFGIRVDGSFNKYGQKWKVYSIAETDRMEDVWCLEVEDDHSFVLEGGISTGNCTSSYADRPEFFGEAFYILLCGAGVGFSVQKHHVARLPKIAARKKQPKIYAPTDDIEGWATCVDVLMSSYFVGGGKYPEYEGRRVMFDLSNIRPKGSFISGGFKAPGPDGLRLALDRIEHLLQRLILVEGVDQLRPIHVYDIVMHESDAVLSGGVRRSAAITLFSDDDEEMLTAKTGNWWVTNPQRGRSNNSAVMLRSEVTREKFDRISGMIKQYGEPGFYFVDTLEQACNPCVEIGMFPQLDGVSGWQGCNLSEINGAKVESIQEFYDACRAAAILGTLQAGYTDFKFLTDTTKKIFEREALIGVSVTGWMNSPDILFNEKVLQNGATIVRATNRELAKILGIQPAARTTCGKPAGTISIFLKTASGVHAEHSDRYLRHVRMNLESDVAKYIMKTNPYMVEEASSSALKTDVIIGFPIVPKKGSITKKDIYGVAFLEKVKMIQENWVEYGTDLDLCVEKSIRHNVSNTVDVDDWPAVLDYIYENRHVFSGISFAAAEGDKAYYQAPNTEVLTANQIVDKYGPAGIMASGLVVDAIGTFDDLWSAIATARGNGENLSLESKENSMKADWCRRFVNFANNYLGGDLMMTDHCLKDVYLLHKWEKITANYVEVDWKEMSRTDELIAVDTLGAAACAGGACIIEF